MLHIIIPKKATVWLYGAFIWYNMANPEDGSRAIADYRPTDEEMKMPPGDFRMLHV